MTPRQCPGSVRVHEQLTKDRIDKRSLSARQYPPSHEQDLGVGPKYPSSAMTHQFLDATLDPIQRQSPRFKQFFGAQPRGPVRLSQARSLIAQHVSRIRKR